jgi:hypothetical protein
VNVVHESNVHDQLSKNEGYGHIANVWQAF